MHKYAYCRLSSNRKAPLTLYRSVTAAWLWIVHAATIPAVQFMCTVRDDSMTAFERQSVCIERAGVPLFSDACVCPQERAERRSSVEVCFHAQLVFCASVVTGLVL